jgi:hypothetical protein
MGQAKVDQADVVTRQTCRRAVQSPVNTEPRIEFEFGAVKFTQFQMTVKGPVNAVSHMFKRYLFPPKYLAKENPLALPTHVTAVVHFSFRRA